MTLTYCQVCLQPLSVREALWGRRLNGLATELCEKCGLATHYGSCVIPARIVKPKDKAKVEAGVLFASRWILASLRNKEFYSLSEANEAVGIL